LIISESAIFVHWLNSEALVSLQLSMDSMNVETASLKEAYKNYLETRRIQVEPSKLYEPVNYIMNLGGKHIRAIFLLLTNSLYQIEPTEDAIRSAYAIEMFHNFSLVHDDIMDDADTRRGQPSVHAKYNISTGILSGDVMLILVYEELLKIQDPVQKANVLNLFTQTAKEVCEGQQYDIDFENRDDVSIEDYILMIKLKTAVLLACALKIGAMLGGASEEDAQYLYDFGINIGISFQIQDDLLDTYGEQARVGKIIGGDIQQNKKTILYLTTLQNLKGREDEFKSLYNSKEALESKLPKVKAMMEEGKVKETTSKLKDHFLDKALDSLKMVKSTNRAGLKELEAMALYIIRRKQ
jgi:geranylgeranyl diphosphate synthase type II